MNETIRVSDVVPATPERVYDAWLSSAEHSAFTGTKCAIEPSVYGRHSEGDGYIEGVTLEFDRGRRIVQTWRSTDFPPGCPDSQLEVLLEVSDVGTRVTFVHTDIPAGQGAMYEDGWRRFYLEPMKGYFMANASAPKAKAASKAKPKAKQAVKAKAKAKVKAKAAVKSKAGAKAKPAAKKKPKAKVKTKAKPGRAAKRGGRAKAPR